ncbi:uncharacterized protein EV422DRAFT_191887 [Fimicolochytrium jonesii]|uniref:uncharacterized protein n=1 Tax=Fimicolochytrium jonesii TaxID=1396493 RepID=UPI0022FEB62D|nr:uncharacterized protein EV422DRAFT_191887 [Fimicolochytrium jonesii]KAI8818146.1 hypothetical protein EV422DRAFT_191887 [Fimicolochytrium jonesii]
MSLVLQTKRRNESEGETEGKRAKLAAPVHGFSRFNTLLKQDEVGIISRFSLNVESAEECATTIAHPNNRLHWVTARRKHLFDQLGAGEKDAIEGIPLSPTPPTPGDAADALDALLSAAKRLLTYADPSIEFGLFTFDHTTERATATGTSPMLSAMLSDGSANADNVYQRIETHFRTLAQTCPKRRMYFTSREDVVAFVKERYNQAFVKECQRTRFREISAFHERYPFASGCPPYHPYFAALAKAKMDEGQRDMWGMYAPSLEFKWRKKGQKLSLAARRAYPPVCRRGCMGTEPGRRSPAHNTRPNPHYHTQRHLNPQHWFCFRGSGCHCRARRRG